VKYVQWLWTKLSHLLQRDQLPAKADVSRPFVDSVAPEHEVRAIFEHKLRVFRLRHAPERRVTLVPTVNQRVEQRSKYPPNGLLRCAQERQRPTD
jgi:hypothetical protein